MVVIYLVMVHSGTLHLLDTQTVRTNIIAIWTNPEGPLPFEVVWVHSALNHDLISLSTLRPELFGEPLSDCNIGRGVDPMTVFKTHPLSKFEPFVSNRQGIVISRSVVRDRPSAWSAGFTKPRIRAVFVSNLERTTLPSTRTLVRMTAAGEGDARVIDMRKVVIVRGIQKISTEVNTEVKRGTTANKPKNHMDYRPVLNCVVPECSVVFELLSSKDHSLLVSRNTLYSLELLLEAVNCIGRSDVESYHFPCERFDQHLELAWWVSGVLRRRHLVRLH